jgi:hypothetical protein
VTLSLHASGAGVQGWTVGLCYDPTAVSLAGFEASSRLLTLREGAAPAFLFLEEATAPGIGGVTQAVVLDFVEHRTLPIDGGAGFEVLELEFQVARETGLRTCSGLVGSGQPVSEVITIDGATYRPETHAENTLVPQPEAWFSVTPDVSNGPVTVSIHSAAGGIQGWSYSLCHDPSKVSIERFSPTRELVTVRHGDAPDFLFEEETQNGARAGIIQAVVLAFTEVITLPGETEGGFPALTVEYDVAEESVVTFCSGLQGSGQPVNLVVTIQGNSSRLPRQHARSTLIVDPYADTLAYRVEPPETSGVATVRLYSAAAPVEGWSFALCHTQDRVRLLEMRPSAELEQLVDGEPPELVLTDVREVAPFVAVTQSVHLGGSGAALIERGPFPDGLSLLDLRYEVLEEDDLKFCDHVGSITFDNSVRIDRLPYVPRTRTGARLVPGALGNRFIRGDADLSRRLELTDAVVVLVALFLGGRPLACLDAADANDVGRVDISDPIYVLRYLYLGGPPPPTPFPEPGEELSPTTALGCERGL